MLTYRLVLFILRSETTKDLSKERPFAALRVNAAIDILKSNCSRI